jgi:hypothetical protein
VQPAKEKTVGAKKPETTASRFVELLQQQIEILRGGEYEYEYIDIYTAGADVPWRFGPEDELQIDAAQGVLVARDGPSNEEGNEHVPEYVIRMDAIVGSQLV